MQSNISDNKDEFEYANLLYKKNYLPGPKNCICGNKIFMIYKDSTNKTSGCSFRCGNYKCRRKYKILINSFYELFPNKQLKLVS